MKTALIFTGGTIGSGIKEDGFIALSSGGKYDILDGCNADGFDIIEPYTILSENLDDTRIMLLLKCISENLKNHDGVIVMHGTDTLQYSAAAAAYAFGNDTVPIVFVSSNYVLSDSRANGRDNFRAAVDFIKSNRGCGAFISYKNADEPTKIHRAARVLPYLPYSDYIASIGGEYGRYENGGFVKNADYIEISDETEPFGLVDLGKAKVLKISAYPNMKIETDADAILIETYHSGTVAETVVDTDKKIFILGVEDRVQYASVKAYERPNVTVLKKAPAPAMYMKLKTAIAAGRLKDMNKALGGDFTK